MASTLALGGIQAQGPKVGVNGNNTPKPGIFLKGPMQWGRLVDVKTTTGAITNPNGTVNDFYLDTPIQESVGLTVNSLITSDETKGKPREAIVSLSLETDPDSGHQTLKVGGTIKNPPNVQPAFEIVKYNKSPKSAFQKAFKFVTSNLGNVAVGGPTSLPPFSQVPRDAALILNFDRAVNPKSIGPDTIQIYVGAATAANQLPPAPFQGRFIYKTELPKQVIVQPKIGDIDDSRIETEIANNLANPKKFFKINPQVLPLNSLGFPASQSTVTFNVAVFIPSEYKLENGVSRILLGKDATAVDSNKSITKFSYNPSNPNGSASDGTLGVVRVFRAGGSGDPNQGFLADKTIPSILGTQPVTLDVIGGGLLQNIITLTYMNAGCDLNVRINDSIRQGNVRAQVSEILDTSAAPTYTVKVDYLDPDNPDKFNITDPALYTTSFDSALATKSGCFVLVAPQPPTIGSPITNVDPQSTFTVRFSKPMDVSRLNAFENFVLVSNSTLVQPALAGPFDIVVSNVIASPDLKQFRVIPFLPLPHTQGSSETMKLFVVAGAAGLTDLAGNPLGFTQFSFTPTLQIQSTAPSNTSRGINWRFDSIFEGPPGGPFPGPAMLVSGQVTSPTSGEVSGRAPTHFSRDADPSNPLVNAMAPFNQAIQTPLVPLGSRLMTIYRHIDLNLSVNTLTEIDLDVEGLAWAPFSAPFSDIFKQIRIDLSHCFFHPDESINQQTNLPNFPTSGLSEQSFNANIFQIADHPEQIVYQGQYAVNPNSAFVAPSGTPMMKWPAFQSSYTWRDSTYGSKKFGGPGGNGVNVDQYFIILGIPIPNPGTALKPWPVNSVPSVGLPLLMDFRTYPAGDPNTKGLNGFQVTIAVTSSSKPNFRVFSSGGLDTQQAPKTVTPDIAPDGVTPTGGYFPPGSTQGTPGTKTPPGGPEVYWGSVDLAVKVSRVFTHFYDLTTAIPGLPNVTSPQFNNSNQLIIPSVQPPGTSVTADFRGATTITPVSAQVLTDARCFDAYGDPYPNANTIPPASAGLSCGTVSGIFPAAGATVNFTSDLTQINARRYLQVRINFTNDITNNVAPSISAYGIAYSNP